MDIEMLTKKEIADLDEVTNFLVGLPLKTKRTEKRLAHDTADATSALREAAALLDPGVLSADGKEGTDRTRARVWIYHALLRLAGR